MKKKTRNNTIKKDAQPSEQFATPTREEKLAFLDFIITESPQAEIPPGTEEDAADKLIDWFRVYIEQAGVGKPANLAEMWDILRFWRSFGHISTYAGAGPAQEQECAIEDFKDAPLTKKRQFFEALKGTVWDGILEEAQDNDELLNRIIQMWLKMAWRQGYRPATLDDLITLVHPAAEVMRRLSPETENSLARSLSTVKQAMSHFSLKERLELSLESLEQIAPDLRKKQEGLALQTQTALKETKDPQRSAALFGSFMNQWNKLLPDEFQRSLEQTARAKIDEKLDEIQKRLGELNGTQEKLEKIQDQLTEFMEAGRNPAQPGEVPPMPIIDESSPSKKEYTVDRERLTGTIDPVLYDLFQQERKARGVTVSRMLDITYWQRYNKPKLSFEIKVDESPLTEPPAPGPEQGVRKRGRPRKKQG